MIHHYLQKGRPLEELVNANEIDKMFMKASMDLHFEEENAKWGTT